MPSRVFRLALCLILHLVLASGNPVAFAQEMLVDFRTDIAPIFEAKCLRCHSANNAQGDISLATGEDLDVNTFVVAGEPDSSYLLQLISPQGDESAEMPKEGEALAEDEVSLVRKWIEQGADWPEGVLLDEKSKADDSWWSLQPLKFDLPQGDTERSAESTGSASTGSANVSSTAIIDAFVNSRLQRSGLARNGPADRRTLIRRATYDLHGLPPTVEEVEAFENDSNPKAYERLLDRLLASPRYGERWGRHWLDVVRFGESNGFERNVLINNLWPFRDYVIRSINEDKPFDRFIREHVAGDVLEPDNPDAAVGTAFLVAGPYDDVGNQDAAQAAQIRANTLDEMIRATSSAFLGLTVGCARCHYHKFDPISQQDYYSMYATFAGVRHGAVPLATSEAKAERNKQLEPINTEIRRVEKALRDLDQQILERGRAKLSQYTSDWVRVPVDRSGTEEQFAPVEARFVRLVCDAQDRNLSAKNGFGIDEMEVWTAGEASYNTALAQHGAMASGEARKIEDFPGAYGPQLAIDGEFGERFLATGDSLTIDLGQPRLIERVVFSSARGEPKPEQDKFRFVAEYRIEVSANGETWQEVASGRDRATINQTSHLDHRLRKLASTDEDALRTQSLNKELKDLRGRAAAIPPIPSVFIGTRNAAEAAGTFHVFLGGSPQRKGQEVKLASLSGLQSEVAYQLPPESLEGERRKEFASWLTHEDNPLTPRVLANRVWHYHFGTGIVNTPSDFGYMGGEPSHPQLLDYLATLLKEGNWQLKSLHRAIMLTETYRQSSVFQQAAADVDSEARLLWRFPPRRLSAEEIRDLILQIAGKLGDQTGGPGFRLYHFMQDNVCTYDPLPQHGPETYRRAVYHQNARAAVVDLMTDFDLPDCAFSTPRRSETTTPLQALTMLNHGFTLDMASALAERLQREAGTQPEDQIRQAFRLCYSRLPSGEELTQCSVLVEEYDLPALCRVLLNTSELIYVE